jgi:periplasmic protein TonB
VFDEVTKQEGGKRAAQRFGYIFGSTAFQIALVALVIVASAKLKQEIIDEKPVEVKFVPRAAPPQARPKPKSDKPRSELPKPPPPQALLQPKEIQAEMKPPDPNEAPEPEYDYGEATGEEGVVGGSYSPSNEIEDAPAYATAGYRKPEMAVRNCVQNSVRIPRDLQGFISGPITVKFAIGRAGDVSRFQLMTTGVPDRVGQLIQQAVNSCRWVPGADAQGRPIAIWVILPLRFTQG